MFWFVGIPLTQSVPLGALGDARILPFLPLGPGQVVSNRQSMSSLQLPNDASLKGARVGLQAVGTHSSLAPGIRLSTLTYLTLR